jgi:O-antigen ligase
MRNWALSDIAFALCVLAFAAAGVQYFSLVFTSTTRWFFLLTLLVVLFFRGELFEVFRQRYSIIFALYSIWCFATIAWSQVEILSFVKASAFFLVSIALISGGIAWGRRESRHGIFSYLAPMVVLAVVTGLFNRGDTINIGALEVHQGLAGNPNHLGILVAMATPFALWFLYENWQKKFLRLIGFGICLALIGILWLSASRASLLCVMFIGCGFFWAVTASRHILVAGFFAFLVAAALVAVPAVIDAVSQRVIYKGNEEGGVLFSRQRLWEESYDLALEGGIIGVGYGVTAGQTEFSGDMFSLTAYGYGREKGNSQLGVWEETGIIGLGLYATLMFLIFVDIFSGFRRTAPGPDKVKLGLLSGVIVGFFVHSAFEAWWVAPGAPEFVYFFAAVGVGSALAAKVAKDRASHLASAYDPFLRLPAVGNIYRS